MSKEATETVRSLRESIGFVKIKKDALRGILDNKIDKIEFKEIKNNILGTLCYICEFLKDGVVQARGVSIRSLLDTFNKKKGKNKAFGRAVKALLSEETSDPIRTDIPDVFITRSLGNFGNLEHNEEFRNILHLCRRYKVVDDKIRYKINPYIPLKIISKKGILYKSEFKPTLPVRSGDIDDM